MESFKTYALNEDKSRFVKANKHLTPAQKEEIIKFLKVNNQADGKLDAKKATTMTYDDYVAYMTQFKSGRKMVLAHKGIKGLKEGTDYVHVKMKTKEYLGYIPLNYETSQKFNTKSLGICQGDWCIGHSSTPAYWNDHTVNDGEVPVYIVNTTSKWVIMIKNDNKRFDIWDINNKHPMPHDSIPNFDVHKELFTPSLIKMYDEIREEHYHSETEVEIDTAAAEEDYDNLIHLINRAADEYERAQEDFDEECHRIKQDTLEIIGEKRDEVESEMNAAKDALDFAKDQYEKWQKDPTYKIFDQKSKQIYMFPNSYESHVIKPLEKKYEALHDEWNKLDDEYNEIEDMSGYEMADSDIEWTEDPPNEENIHDHIDHPYILNGRFSDYFDFAEEHFGFSMRRDGKSLQQNIDEFIYEARWGGGGGTPESILSNHGCYHPDVVHH